MLVLEVFVSSDEYLEACLFCRGEEVAIREATPPHQVGHTHVMMRKIRSEIICDILIKQDLHEAFKIGVRAAAQSMMALTSAGRK